MANIMINEVCNLQCPYCFANKYVNGDCTTEITEENFRKAVDWINNSGGERIGIIGGEPTLHSKFTELLDYAVEHRLSNQEILVFTNGLIIKPYIDYFVANNIDLLINVNSPEDIGEENYETVYDNIALLRRKGVDISVGINFYKPDLDTFFIEHIVEQFGFKSLRTGIVSPNTQEKINQGSLAHYKVIKEPIMQFIRIMADLGCGVHFDCQKIPKCILLDSIDELEEIKEKIPNLDILNHCCCAPVLDILPDLKVVRCFGVSDRSLAVPMESFSCEGDLVGYFERGIDNIARLLPCEEECIECYYSRCGECQGGCLTYKMRNVEVAYRRIFGQKE